MTPSGDFQLRLGYWIVSHKQTLRSWWGMSLLSFIGLSLLWLVIFLAIFFSQQRQLDAFVAQTAGAAAGFNTQSFRPQPIVLGPATIIVRDPAHVDLVATVTNPNQDWAASTLTVHFVVDGHALASQQLWLNANVSRPVIALNQAVAATASSIAEVMMDTAVWSRNSATSFPPPSFTVDKQTLTPTTVNLNGQTRPTYSLLATITNRSVYNFYQVTVPILLMSGTKPVAVDELPLVQWPTLSTKTVTVTWPYAVTGATSATIVPQVNQFDSQNIYR